MSKHGQRVNHKHYERLPLSKNHTSGVILESAGPFNRRKETWTQGTSRIAKILPAETRSRNQEPVTRCLTLKEARAEEESEELYGRHFKLY